MLIVILLRFEGWIHPDIFDPRFWLSGVRDIEIEELSSEKFN